MDQLVAEVGKGLGSVIGRAGTGGGPAMNGFPPVMESMAPDPQVEIRPVVPGDKLVKVSCPNCSAESLVHKGAEAIACWSCKKNVDLQAPADGPEVDIADLNDATKEPEGDEGGHATHDGPPSPPPSDDNSNVKPNRGFRRTM
jgi:ribosomal protein S27E